MFILSTKTLLWLVKEINDLHGLNRSFTNSKEAIWHYNSTLCQRRMLAPAETGYLVVSILGLPGPMDSWVSGSSLCRAERRSPVTGSGECSCRDCSLKWISCLTY